MSSHKGPGGAQGSGAPASTRETDTVELAELGPLLEEKGKRGIANPTKAEEEQACPAPQEEEEEVRVLTLPLQAHHAMEKMEEFVYKVWEGRWRVIPYDVLPDWLKDNDYLLHGHRPPMPSFRACFRSIFRIHTETGNIWTHLLGEGGLRDVLLGRRALPQLLLALSHRLLSLRESLPDFFQPRLIYLSIVCVLGISAIIVAQWDRFATPKHRQTRAGVFLGLGLSGVVPTMHFTIAEGFVKATTVGQMGWFFLMAVMYITGAGLYAARIPERFFPGKFDIWFQSHQIFHVLVVAAAFIHFYGVSNLQEFRYGLEGGCTDDSLL
ncbi:adiponectin receptor protein 1 isoform X2 [Phyllostomus hastatus]|uniref:adiponectin receptor protein 1 isoform X2 n=1 Tax=Phyllostomus hastatus TaxID=9423 RepID=UPI001E67E901|nr:adiponectin receptor protein 1 isoform X2 [Phyllostomus hastatus]